MLVIQGCKIFNNYYNFISILSSVYEFSRSNHYYKVFSKEAVKYNQARFRGQQKRVIKFLFSLIKIKRAKIEFSLLLEVLNGQTNSSSKMRKLYKSKDNGINCAAGYPSWIFHTPPKILASSYYSQQKSKQFKMNSSFRLRLEKLYLGKTIMGLVLCYTFICLCYPNVVRQSNRSLGCPYWKLPMLSCSKQQACRIFYW